MIVNVNETATRETPHGDSIANRLPRGIRNRNPGNIRKSGDRWKGLAPLQSDPAFFIFETPLWGIRAMATILRNYQRRHGLKSLVQIIGRWAPPTRTIPPTMSRL